MYPMLPLSDGPRVLKADCGETRSVQLQLQLKSCVSLVDIVSSEDSLRSSRNSVQALLESRLCIPSTRFNNWTVTPRPSQAGCSRLAGGMPSHNPFKFSLRPVRCFSAAC